MFFPVSIFQMIRRAKASALMAASLSFAMALPPSHASAVLIGRAVLPAETFAKGPTSGQQLSANPINGQAGPFVKKQPVQGFSAVGYAGKGRFEIELKGNGQPVKKPRKST